MGAAVAAVIAAKERQMVDAFRAVGATTPERAMTPDEVGISENIGFSRLRRHEVLRQTAPGHYYLDEPVWNAVRATRRRVVLVLLTIIGLLAVAIWLGAVTLH